MRNGVRSGRDLHAHHRQPGWVPVGTDHDATEFAVNTIRTWRQATGRAVYPTRPTSQASKSPTTG
ncbi:ISAzo13-like element transposase-related protein [Aeromicrobium sp.]|uniref:ISAzo13-like element transposase-related protein n=1 Tax=Aeromicrobium sp. TaxID=1871063 RepID=UPI0039E438EF